MADVYPAQRGKMGTTEYYVLTIKARALVGLVTFQTTDSEWDNVTLEERDQRNLNMSRVRTQIAPYLRNDPNHFMGAIVLQAEKLAKDCFDPLLGSGGISPEDVTRPYRDSAKRFGFLNLTGGETLKPLDGQHRLKALEFAIRGLDDHGDQLPPVVSRAGRSTSAANDGADGATARIADEDVTVIIVRANLTVARKIFTDINSYAKPVGTGQNLITNDSETHAVLARRLANELVGPRLVLFKTNNLSAGDFEFTTLSTLSKGVKEVLKVNFPPKRYDKYPSLEKERRLLWDTTKVIWEELLPGIELWNQALADKTADGDDQRKDLRKGYLCLRPVPQLCIIQAYIHVTSVAAATISKKEAIAKLNKIPWGTEDPLWDRVLWSGRKVQEKNARIVTELLKYMLLGDKIGQQAKMSLLDKYRLLFPQHKHDPDIQLPDPV